ncbi:MAG: hypothetical protein QM699_03875 [Amaricoccus sp.]|uniref:hypothetical protein n=1 Tax=Amaricoccus sp. TaxID=1872485 RepID=UPI0039E3DEEE
MNGIGDMGEVGGDVGRGLGTGAEEIVIGTLIMMPFVGTLVVLLGWMLPLPSVLAILLFVALAVPAGLWNAGMRARLAAA